MGSVETVFQRHITFEGFFSFFDFNSFIATEKGASIV